MVAHEKRNSAQLFCAVPTQNDLALSSLLFSAHPTQKLGYPARIEIKGPYRDKRTRREKRGTSLSVSCPNMAEGRGNPRVGLSA